MKGYCRDRVLSLECLCVCLQGVHLLMANQINFIDLNWELLPLGNNNLFYFLASCVSSGSAEDQEWNLKLVSLL